MGWSSFDVANRIVFIDQVPIGIVFDDESVQIVPVVKNLAPLNMAPNPPERLVPLGMQVFMASEGRVDTFHLECRMVDSSYLGAEGAKRASQEERVVVGELLPHVDVHEDEKGRSVVTLQDVRGLEVEMGAVEVDRLVHVPGQISTMTEFMYRCRPS